MSAKDASIWIKEGDGFLRTGKVAEVNLEEGTIRYPGGAGRPSLRAEMLGKDAIVVSTEQKKAHSYRIAPKGGVHVEPASEIEVIGRILTDERTSSDAIRLTLRD